jgi:hypothetical protein
MNIFKCVRLQVLTAASMNVTVLQDAAPYRFWNSTDFSELLATCIFRPLMAEPASTDVGGM